MDGSWFERKDHPLMNHVILEIVFEHVRPTDLRACRLVNTKWNLSTIPFTRSSWPVTIHGSQNWKGITHFVEVINSNTLGIPFARYRLEPFSMTDNSAQQFLKLCGNTINEIDLRRMSSVSFAVQDISTLLMSTPNLVNFGIPVNVHSGSGNNFIKLFPDDSKPKLMFLNKLTTLPDKPENRMKCCPTFIEELMTIGENISELSIAESNIGGSNMPTDTQYTRTSVEVLTIIEKLKRKSSIQTLHFSEIHEKDVEILSRIKKSGMKFRKLTVLDQLRFPQQIRVASLYKDTIQYLSIGGSCTSLIDFPMMPQLSALSMGISINFDTRFVSLNKIFPALGRMELWGNGNECEDFLPESDSCSKMKLFSLYDTFMKSTAFNCIPILFPNLIQFEIDVKEDGVEILRIIWTQMAQLEVLTLSGSIPTLESLDSIFTGISTKTLQDIAKEVKELEETTPELRRESVSKLRNEFARFPSVLELTNLRALNLRVSTEGDEKSGHNLTDLAGYLAFYPMKQLRHLSLDHCTITKICSEILAVDTGLEISHFRRTESEEYMHRYGMKGYPSMQ